MYFHFFVCFLGAAAVKEPPARGVAEPATKTFALAFALALVT